MIHEEIVTYEVAKLAKEKGFPQDECGVNIGYYAWDGLRKTHPLVNSFAWYNDEYNHDNLFLAPTQSLLQRWLREEKGIHIVIESEPTTTTSSNMLFQWIINYNSDGECYDCYNDIRAYPSYEKTLESALKFALENLV